MRPPPSDLPRILPAELSITALILNEPFDKIVQKSQVDGLDVVPADKNLAGAAVELVLAENREYKLQAVLNEIRDRYKFIVLDCPPALDLLTLNALFPQALSWCLSSANIWLLKAFRSCSIR